MKKVIPCYIVLSSLLFGLLLQTVVFGNEQPAIPEALKQANPQSLKLAIEDMAERFPEKQQQWNLFRDKLDKFQKAIDRFRQTPPKNERAVENILEKYNTFKRAALLSNPLVSEHDILFVVRRQYRVDHHNTATLFQTGEINTDSFTGGGAMKSINLATGKVTTLIELKDGIARDPEVYFDGSKIIFSMRKNIQDDYHIYEMKTDGSGLRQLTRGSGLSDIDPLYLPDDMIAFTSSREPKYCMCNAHIMANMFKMGPDGENIHQLGKSTLFEGHGALLEDGRILYDRWEYVDRNFGDAQGLWTVNPDGTNHAIYWGNNTNSPGGVIDARPIPGTQQVICIFGSCHDRPWGALTILDRRLGLDDREGVVQTWPAHAINRVGKGNWDAFMPVNPKYEDPYPLNDTYFLCSRTTGHGEQMGIYLIDRFGNEILLHTEGAGCYDPMPIKPTHRPQSIPDRRDYASKTGQFYVVNVYEGTHMTGVKPGSVKYLRVVESPEKRSWTGPSWGGQGVHRPAMNWHSFENKRILGTVPVEEDGSVFFEVPAEKFVFFQLLDENGMMIQSMRSGTIIQPGEMTGCIGCHDNRRIAPPKIAAQTPKALTHKPDKLEGWYGPPRIFSYLQEVQPVFDKNCMSCHDYGTKAGKKLNLAGDMGLTFNQSYHDLWRKGGIKAVGAGPSEVQQAYSWGSHASKLVKVIRAGHKDINLDAESFDRIVTWIDINAPYYPTYLSAYPGNLAGRSPLTPAQVKRLAELTGVPFAGLANHGTKMGQQVSFDRPEKSPCLKKFADKNDAGYKEALGIIRAGADMLKKTPRADMPGFSPSDADRARNQKYLARRKTEQSIRQAISDGKKIYDAPTN